MVVTFNLQSGHRRFASMSLFRYFSPVCKPYLPNPEEEGTSSEASEVQTINREVERRLETQGKQRSNKRKITNFHYDVEILAKIGRYAAENGNKNAMERFSRDLQSPLSESTVRGFKKAYYFELRKAKNPDKI